MKINELINEAMPYGFGSYLKHQIRSNIPFGAAGRAQAMGKTQVGMRANQEFQIFHQWLGSFNGQATMPNLIHFLKGRRFKTAGVEEKYKTLPRDKPLNDKQVGQIIQDVIQAKFAPPAPTTPTPPAPTTPTTPTPPAPTTPTPPAPTTPTPRTSSILGPDGKPIQIS
jgi:hypothetical protein